jgi:4-amino-4-deoxy-L-arabinose transferase-like glycosyltransferase
MTNQKKSNSHASTIFRQWVSANRVPVAAVALHLLLAVYYSASFPIFEGSDEGAHFFFARRLAQTGSIPDVRYEPGPWQQEATQGPLYYLTAAIPIGLVDTSDAEGLNAQLNPFVNLGDASRPGNKNLFIHDPRRESWPWRGATLAVHLARWVSAVYGALGIWFTYLLARRLAPQAAGATALFVALLPQFVWASGSVTNETASASMAALALWIWVAAPRQWPARRLIALGVALALAALAKLPGLILMFYLSGVMALSAIPVSWREAIRRLGVMGLAFAIVAGPWLMMNMSRYGDPTAMSALVNKMAGTNINLFSGDTLRNTFTPDFLATIHPFTIAIVSSLWGVFGGHNIIAPSAVYSFFNWLLTIGGIGFGLHVFLGHKQIRSLSAFVNSDMALQLWLAGWLLLHFATLLLWAYRAGGVAGRLLFPALPVIAFIFAIGWWRLSQWLPPVLARVAQALPPAALGLFALAAPAWLIIPEYALPPTLAELPPSAKPLNLHYGALELVGIDSQSRVDPGDQYAVTFYWRLAQPTTDEYRIFPRLLDGTLAPVAGTSTYPGWGNWPVNLWTPGVIYADHYEFPVGEYARRPSLGRVIVAVEENQVTQPITAADGNPFDPIWPLAEVALSPDPRGLKDLAGLKSLAVFGDAAALLEAHFPETARPGEEIQVELLWQSRKPTIAAWQRFVHLDDGNRVDPHLVAQSDGVPANGYGPAWWQGGDLVPDAVVLTLPADLPAGQYGLWTGFAQPTGPRVVISGGDNQDGRLFLGMITVQ